MHATPRSGDWCVNGSRAGLFEPPYWPLTRRGTRVRRSSRKTPAIRAATTWTAQSALPSNATLRAATRRPPAATRRTRSTVYQRRNVLGPPDGTDLGHASGIVVDDQHSTGAITWQRCLRLLTSPLTLQAAAGAEHPAPESASVDHRNSLGGNRMPQTIQKRRHEIRRSESVERRIGHLLKGRELTMSGVGFGRRLASPCSRRRSRTSMVKPSTPSWRERRISTSAITGCRRHCDAVRCGGLCLHARRQKIR